MSDELAKAEEWCGEHEQLGTPCVLFVDEYTDVLALVRWAIRVCRECEQCEGTNSCYAYRDLPNAVGCAWGVGTCPHCSEAREILKRLGGK